MFFFLLIKVMHFRVSVKENKIQNIEEENQQIYAFKHTKLMYISASVENRKVTITMMTTEKQRHMKFYHWGWEHIFLLIQ